jgi:hypothetical protein
MKNAFLATIIIVVVLGLSVLLITSCSPVKFYSDEGLTKSTGLKYYTVKPYLQVERDPQNNSIVKATIIYLPDLAHPQYLEIKAGPGSRKVDLKLENGAINTFGMTSDTQIPETIEALAALVSKTSDAVKDLSLKGIPPTASQSTITEFYEIIMTDGSTTVRKIEIK